MAAFAAFYREIRQKAKGVPEPTMDYALNRAARMFCSRSWYVRRRVTLMLVAGQNYYTLAFSDDEEGIGCKYVEINGRPLGVGNTSQFDPTRGPGRPCAFVFEPTASLIFDRQPDAAATYAAAALVAIQPKLDSLLIPDELEQNYMEGVAAGALSWILSMKDERWSDPAEGVRLANLFSAAINNAKGIAMKDFQTRDLRAAPAPFIIRSPTGYFWW